MIAKKPLICRVFWYFPHMRGQGATVN
jgi:hypothetical protein